MIGLQILFAVFVPWLSAPLPLRQGRHSFVPFIRAFPVPQGLTFHAQSTDQLCQIDFLATAPRLLSNGSGLRRLHIYPALERMASTDAGRKIESPAAFPPQAKNHVINLLDSVNTR